MRILGYTLIKTATLEHEGAVQSARTRVSAVMVGELLARNHSLDRDRCAWCGRARSKTPTGRGQMI